MSGTSIDFDDLETPPGLLRHQAAGGRRSRSRSCPTPSAGPRWCTLISVDDHLVEPPHMFEGRMPAQLRRPRARRCRARRRAAWSTGSTTASATTRSASTPSSAGPWRSCSFEPTRFDEMRRGAWDIDARVARHGPQRRLRLAELPVVARRVRRPALPARRERPGPGPRRGAGGQRLAPRGVGRHPPGPDHPVPAAVAARPGARAPTEVRAQRRPRLPRRHLPRAARAPRPAVAAHRLLGPVHGGVRGDRHRRLPARRLVVERAHRRRPTRRPTPSACCSSAGRCSPPSTGSTRRSRCASPT